MDHSDQRLEIGLAAPSRDAGQMLRLFERGLESVEAGFGIDSMRLISAARHIDLEPDAHPGSANWIRT